MKLSARETAIFGMLGALMYASKMIMEVAPNIHLLGVFVIALIVVYRQKALHPIYTYVFINGLMVGFSTWWIPFWDFVHGVGNFFCGMLICPIISIINRIERYTRS